MVLLPWTPPYDWGWMVGFLQARAVAGVERFHDGGYSRSFRVAGHGGLIHLAPDEEAQGLRVTLSPGLQPVAEICYARIGQLFDLTCDPQQVAARRVSTAKKKVSALPTRCSSCCSVATCCGSAAGVLAAGPKCRLVSAGCG